MSFSINGTVFIYILKYIIGFLPEIPQKIRVNSNHITLGNNIGEYIMTLA